MRRAERTGPHASILWAFLDDPILWIDTELFYWNSVLLALCFLESTVAYRRHRSEQETELQVLSVCESLTREQPTTVLESAVALGELRHEVKNHYLVLQDLSRTGETERLIGSSVPVSRSNPRAVRL